MKNGNRRKNWRTYIYIFSFYLLFLLLGAVGIVGMEAVYNQADSLCEGYAHHHLITEHIEKPERINNIFMLFLYITFGAAGILYAFYRHRQTMNKSNDILYLVTTAIGKTIIENSNQDSLRDIEIIRKLNAGALNNRGIPVNAQIWLERRRAMRK